MYTISYLGNSILRRNYPKNTTVLLQNSVLYYTNVTKTLFLQEKRVDKTRIMVYNATCNENVTKQKLKRN